MKDDPFSLWVYLSQSPLLWLTVTLLVYAAAAKLLVFQSFHRQLLHQPIPAPVAGLLWPLIPAAELLAAILLTRPQTRATGLRLSFLLLFLFSGYAALAWLHWWSRAACPCGGILGQLSWGRHLLFNLAFLAINSLAVYQTTPDKPG